MDVIESKSRGGGRTFFALLAGMAAGAAVMTLFAPDKGQKTREKIARSARDFTDSIRERGEEGLSALRKVTMRSMPFISEPASSGQSHRRQRTGGQRRTRTTRATRSTTKGPTAGE